jgi:hypothetical protein
MSSVQVYLSMTDAEKVEGALSGWQMRVVSVQASRFTTKVRAELACGHHTYVHHSTVKGSLIQCWICHDRT